jgi:hypothetical protein
MFGKSKITLQNEIKYLENRIKSLEIDLESERRVVKGYEKLDREKRINQDLENAARREPVMIDFDKVDVWSIERAHKDGTNYTIVGVLESYSENGALVKRSKDYKYYVNSDGHNRIIAAYEAHRAKKEKKK